MKSTSSPPDPTAPTKYGLVEGIRIRVGRSHYNVFLGVPYAKAPLGELRFERPQPPDSWLAEGRPRLAKRYGPRSVQKDFWWDQLELRVPKSEDCLHLNIIAPSDSLNTNQGSNGPKYAVLFYIHGGGYVMDSAPKYHYRNIARTLVRHGVIVVTIQYRLGFLGFWCTGHDGVCRGNMGLWDQLAALRWVKENIAGFGGDPENITVIGHSAGAASADLLSLSPLSRELFNRVILMGGNAEAVWAVAPRDTVTEFCRAKALKLGFPHNQNQWSREDSLAMMDFMRRVPATRLAMTMLGDRSVVRKSRIPLTPVIDGELLPKSLKELRAETPVRQVMAGVAEHEGLLFLAVGCQRVTPRLLSFLEAKAEELVMEIDSKGPEERLEATAALHSYYGFDEESIRKDKRAMAGKTVAIMSDLISNFPLENYCTEMLRNGSTIYRYSFEHFNPATTLALNFMLPFVAPTHCTELAYLFDVNVCVLPWRRTTKDREVRDLTTRLWTNFAKYGNPNGEGKDESRTGLAFDWEPIDTTRPQRHLAIRGTGGLASVMRQELEEARVGKLAPNMRQHIQ